MEDERDDGGEEIYISAAAAMGVRLDKHAVNEDSNGPTWVLDTRKVQTLQEGPCCDGQTVCRDARTSKSQKKHPGEKVWKK
jgi:hypothetical protein